MKDRYRVPSGCCGMAPYQSPYVVSMARLLSGILFYFLGFLSPIILPLSPKCIYFIPRRTHQPRWKRSKIQYASCEEAHERAWERIRQYMGTQMRFFHTGAPAAEAVVRTFPAHLRAEASQVTVAWLSLPTLRVVSAAIRCQRLKRP